jgi:hypothetical protein
VIALVLVLAPFVDAFWARDLGALHRELQENPASAQRALFSDLLGLTTCDRLEKLAVSDPLRALVRIEEARRGAARTIWDDILQESFFRRKVWNPEGADLLQWPDEQERWPGEVLLVGPLRWQCGKAQKGAGALALLTVEVLRSLPPEAAARAAYERAVLLWRTGSTEGAAAVDPASLDVSLRPAARFLRLEAKVDPPEGWIALAADWPDLAVRTRAAWELLRQRRYEDIVRFTDTPEPAQGPARSEMAGSILWVRAVALQALGNDAEMLVTLERAKALPGGARHGDAIRALAMSALARRPPDADLLQRFAGGEGIEAAWVELAHRALAAGNLRTAREAAARLQQVRDARWRAEGLALAGEIGWTTGEVKATQAALDQLFSPGWRAAEREPRDLAALQLAHAMVLTDAESGGTHAELQLRLASLRDRLSARDAAQVEALLASLREAPPERGVQRLALGQVDVVRAPEPPPPPAVQVELPEPRSLLAIPSADGTLRDWFDPRGAP